MGWDKLMLILKKKGISLKKKCQISECGIMKENENRKWDNSMNRDGRGARQSWYISYTLFNIHQEEIIINCFNDIRCFREVKDE